MGNKQIRIEKNKGAVRKDKSFQLVRYYGWYSNRCRGEREKRKQAVNLPKVPTTVEIIDV